MFHRVFQAVGRQNRSVLVLISVGYAALALVSIALFQFEDGVAGIWLPNAFAVAIVLRNPSLRFAYSTAAVAVGCIAANLLAGASPANSLFYAAANVTTVLIETMLIRKAFGDRSPVIGNARDYLLMMAAGGVAAPAVAALLFAVVAMVAMNLPFQEAFWPWIVGEFLGFSALLSTLMTLDRTALAGLVRRAPLARLALSIGGCIAIAAVVANWTQFPFLLVIVPLMIAAIFAAPFEMAVACGTVAVALVGLVVAGAISKPVSADGGFIHGFQLSIAILAALPFLAGLVMEQTRRDRRRIAESEQRFRRAMEDSAIGVAIVGLDGRIVESNRAFADMLGYPRGELEALKFADVTHPDDLSIGLETMRKVRAGELNSYQFEKRYIRKDGSAVWARLFGSAIRDDETGQPLYLVSQVEDIDAQKRAKAAIADAETRWNFALASAGQGMWDSDMKSGRTTYSSTWEQMLGYEHNELDGDPYHWLTLVHPDDRGRVAAADEAHIAGRTPLFEEEFRMRHKEGHWIWILDRGQVVERDENGAPLRAIGTLTDITMRREAEDRLLSYAAMLNEEKERLRVTLDSIGDAVICTDAAMRVTFMNPVAEKLTGVVEKRALGKRLERVYAPVDEESGERTATAAAIAGLKQRAEHNSRAILSKKDGSRCCIREVVSPIHTERGEFGGSVIVFQDFTDARALQRRLAHEAAHDSLTGLSNRASLLATVAGLVSAPRRDGAGDLFLFVDLDNFKTINDTCGHAAGDVLLRQVAELIRATVNVEDFAARLGGDEFAVILRGCTIESGQAMAAKLIAAISDLGYERHGVTLKIGASVGLTPIRHGETDVDGVISRADNACYEAKAAGRGRVTVVEAPEASGSTMARAS